MVRIVIIGAGISGLSTYLFLRKHLLLNPISPDDIEIKIYEAYDIHQSNFNASLTEPTGIDGPRNAISTNEAEPIFTPQAVGSAIGISQNGLSVLARLDGNNDRDPQSTLKPRPSIIQQMSLCGHPIERWQIGTARGFTIVDVNVAAKPAAKREQSSATTPTPTKDSDLYHGIMIARQSCWEILRDRVLDVSPDVLVRKKVVDVVIGNENKRNIVKSDDGSQDEADLVIGADGLRSIVRRAMFRKDESSTARDRAQDGNAADKSWLQSILSSLLIPFLNPSQKQKQRPSVDKTDFISPHYEGLVGSTGHKPGTMAVVFGPNGFFGYGYLTSAPAEGPTLSNPDDLTTTANAHAMQRSSTTPPSLAAPGPLAGWWSTFSSATPYPYNSSTTSTASNKPSIFDKRAALNALLSRHESWSNRTVSSILEHVKSDTDTNLQGSPGKAKALDASYPTWTTPELPYWQVNGRVVLVGDAAHALQPSSGQGACQALEDAEALALCLKHYLAPPSSATSSSATNTGATTPIHTPPSSPSTLPARLARSLHSYQTLRLSRVHKIYAHSQRMSNMKSDMNWLLEWSMYFVLWMMTRAWLPFGGGLEKYNEELFGYDLPGEVERFLEEREREQGDGRKGKEK